MKIETVSSSLLMTVVITVCCLPVSSSADLSQVLTGYCSFPDFLWKRHFDQQDGGRTRRKWVGRTEYIGQTSTWSSQRQIEAGETDMVIRHRLHASCTGLGNEHSTRSPCYRQELVHRVVCLSYEPGNKYRTIQNVNGKLMFSCYRFVQLSPNSVQVFQAVRKDINEDRLCYDTSLQRDEWPWIDIASPPSQSCSWSGGYTFYTLVGDTRQKVCESESRPSSLEVECQLNQGLVFRFPSDDCNPFHEQSLSSSVRLQCWFEWFDESFRFVILAPFPNERTSSDDIYPPGSTLPRYVLRVPRDQYNNATGETLVYLYYSLVAPLSGRGNPPGNISFAVLHVQRHKNDLDPATTSAECSFPEEFQGNWLTFDKRGVSRVDIDTDRILITSGHMTADSHVTGLVCKSKHWQRPYYKVLDVQNNACLPRYTCIMLASSGDILQQQQSGKFSVVDESFSTCVFEEYQQLEPLRTYKQNLFPLSTTDVQSCGQLAAFHLAVNATFSGSRKTCQGTITNVDPVTCDVTSSLVIELPDCSCHSEAIELECVAHVRLTTGTGLLVTRSSERTFDSQWCWVVKTGIRTTSHNRHTTWLSFDRSHCDTGDIFRTSDDAAIGCQLSALEISGLSARSWKLISKQSYSNSIINNVEYLQEPRTCSCYQ